MAEESNNTTTEAPAEPQALTADVVAQLVNDGINKFVASQKTDIAKLKTEWEAIKTAPNAETQATATNDATADPRYAVLERQLKELQTANEAVTKKAEKADADSALNNALNQFTFANEKTRQIAFKHFASDMAKIGDGEYAIGDQPLADAVKATMADLTGLLAPKNVNGSGASAAKSPAVDVGGFKKGMSREEMQAYALEALKSL